MTIFRKDVAAGFPATGVKTVPRKPGIRIVHNKLLGGWFVVRGPHQTPIGGRYETKADAVAWLNRRK